MPRAIKFSTQERKLRGLLPKSGRRITTAELAAQFFAPDPVPMHGRIRVTNLLRSIKRKTEAMNALPNARPVRAVESTEGSGRATHEAWLA